MGHLGAPPLGRPLAFQIALHSRCAQFFRGFKRNYGQVGAPTLQRSVRSAELPPRMRICYNRPVVERAVEQQPASSEAATVELPETGGSQAALAGSPPIEDACRYCPVCSRRLESRRCKLICPVCGYYMSCADYY